jgi:hypothetical protein
MVAMMCAASGSPIPFNHGQARQLATVEAVDRRRRTKPGRNAARRARRRNQDAARATWEREACQRLVRQHLRRNLPLHPLHGIYSYWQIRRCGWDVMLDEWNLGAGPEQCELWLWWHGLPWRQRDDVAEEKRRRVSVEAVALGLHNPGMVIEGGEEGDDA